MIHRKKLKWQNNINISPKEKTYNSMAVIHKKHRIIKKYAKKKRQWLQTTYGSS